MENTELTTESLDNTLDGELDGGGLPSAQEERQLEVEKFAITDDIKEKYFKNGKLQGRFDDIEGLILANKSVEDKYSALVRDIKSGKYQEVQQSTDVDTSAQQVDVMQVAQPLIERFVSNGMELTDDILEDAKAQGLDIRDVKLAAIEMKEKINQAYSVVGGKEEYEAMLSWAKDALDDKAKSAFDKDLATGAGEWAIKGLYAEYKAKSSQDAPRQRMQGDSSASVGIKPYANQAEMLKDRAYINSARGKHDEQAKALHKQRLDRTPDSVLFGR